MPLRSGLGRRAGCFPAKHQGFKGKARGHDPGFPIYEAEEVNSHVHIVAGNRHREVDDSDEAHDR